MKKINIIFLFLIVATFSLGRPIRNYQQKSDRYLNYEFSRADSAHGFDVLTYDLTLEIDDVNESVTGAVITEVEAEETLTEITYELENMNVDQVLLDGTIANYTYDGSLITIQLGLMNPGELFTTSVEYSGNPIWDGLGMYFGGYHMFTISDPNASRYWWPCYDHPWDKAEVDLHITCREDWDVASNGILGSIVNNGNGTRTHNWNGENPMATYLVSLVTRDLTELNDNFGSIPIQNFVPPGMVANANEDFSNLPFMMETFTGLFGDYPFEKYGNAVTNFATYGAMEHQTMTTLGDYIITGNHTYETTIAHELAHQWFGDCLTCLTWKDIWLSEGFATYSEALYTEAWQGYEAMVNYIHNSIHTYYINWAGNTPYTIYDPPVNSYFTPATYEKPASVLHMLRLKVGDEIFFDILQTYFNDYHNGNVITSDFQETCEEVSSMNLEQFFQQWIYQPGLPALKYTYFFNPYTAIPRIMTYVETESNSDTDFFMQVPFHVNYETSHDSILVDAGPDPVQTISIITTPLYDSVEFDPNNWILSRGNTFSGAEINNAYAADEKVVIYWNEFWEEISVDGYNIFRSESPEGPFELINSELITETQYSDQEVVNGTTYYYRLKAIKDTNYETPYSNTYQATPIAFPFDQGILLVDETMDGAGTQGNPDDVMVDEFYQNVIPTSFTSYDYNQEGAPTIDLVRHYSTIIWHDDYLAEHFISDNIDLLGSYLASGGNLIISGWKTVPEIPNYFLNDLLECGEHQLVSQWEFVGATSEQYQNLHLDPEKLNPAFDGTLPYVSIFPNAINGIYEFDGTVGSSYIGENVALKNELEGEFFLLGFPLYFFQNDDVEQFFIQFLEEIGEVSAGNEIVESKINLFQNYPNPFNPSGSRRGPSTKILFSINSENEENTKLIIYNIKGQKVRTLIDKAFLAGEHSISWDGRNDNNVPVTSGIYFYKLLIDSKFIDTKKMLLIK